MSKAVHSGRSWVRVTGPALGTLAILGFGAVLVLRRGTLRRRSQAIVRRGPAGARPAADIAQEVSNRLGAVRGCCELAKMKSEVGEALTRRMDTAIETLDEVPALVHQLEVRSCR